ncbi:MAG: SDR family NAD(P)-dependent oxidoreductase [Caulobacteraceae bacterium]
MISLENHIALVTGASGDIGRAVAITLASLGADVYIHYNKSLAGAEATAREVRKKGRRSFLVSADLSNHQEIKQMFEYIDRQTGALDILVNNAGVWRSSYVKSLGEEEWDSVLATNLKGAFLCSKYSMKKLIRSENASIVNVSSIAATNAMVGQLSYSVSKAGLISMTKSLAKEFGVFKIRVNAVAPGPVRTQMREIDDEEEKRLSKLIPLKRIAEPEDVANAIAYFCTPMAKYITGQIMFVDGGLSL